MQVPIKLTRSQSHVTGKSGITAKTQSCVLPLLAFMTPTLVLAQSATPGTTVLEEVIVSAHRDTLTTRISALAGGAALIVTDDIPETANLSVSRALATTPGVIVQDFFGGNDQPRIQIRGSGLQQNPVERGVLVLENGLPINRADGSYVVGLANPAMADSIEVYRGYLANRLGATVLGGALNFISPTGRSAPGGRLAISGGSFEQVTTLGQYGWQNDKTDALLQFDFNRRDGYRDYNESERTRLGGNIGLQLNDNVNIRFFSNYTDLEFDVVGPLSKTQMKDDPEAVHQGPTISADGMMNPGPNVIRDQPRRKAEQWLVGTRASGHFGAHIVDLALGYSGSDDSFRFPISSGVRETKSDDITSALRYAYKPDNTSTLPLVEITAQYSTGSADRDYFLNQSGSKGARFGTNELEADTTSLSINLHIPLGRNVTLSPVLAYSDASRDNDDLYRLPTRPTIAYNPAQPDMQLPNGAVPTLSNSYNFDYDGWSPALGVNWQVNDSNMLFAAASRSFEPPTHDDLLATVNGTPFSSAGRPAPPNPALAAAAFATADLKAQRATTVETGWRGSQGIWRWDGTLYYAWVDDELLSLRDLSGVALASANADETRHLGAEMALTAQFTSELQVQMVYNYQDFRFHNDSQRDDKRLAGAPRHWMYLSANYAFNRQWSAAANLRWVMEKYPVDNMNTLYNDDYAIFGLRSDYVFSERLSFFIEASNLFDENYASSTLIVDQARPDQAAFLPGDGRAFYTGLRMQF
ncbi:MAG: TonB-dependent receptor family protein [Parahaliea sp.]